MGNCSSVDELTRMNQLVVEKNQAEKDGFYYYIDMIFII